MLMPPYGYFADEKDFADDGFENVPDLGYPLPYGWFLDEKEFDTDGFEIIDSAEFQTTAYLDFERDYADVQLEQQGGSLQ